MWWIAVLTLLILISPVVQLSNYWFVFGIWPVSWKAFFLFSVISYAYAEAVKKTLKKVIGMK